MSKASVVELRGIGLRSGPRWRVADVDLRVEPGALWGLVGPNGAGKTSLLGLIAGLLAPSAGEGRVLGHDIRTSRRDGRRLGYLPQATSTGSELTVSEFLRFRMALKGLVSDRAAVAAALEDGGLTQVARQRMSTLSGGWRRRAELAAAIAGRPELLLLDEPTVGLDQDARRRIWEVILAEGARGAGVIVNTHDLAEAELCNELALMVDGRVRARGAPRRLIDGARAASLADAWPVLVHGR